MRKIIGSYKKNTAVLLASVMLSASFVGNVFAAAGGPGETKAAEQEVQDLSRWEWKDGVLYYYGPDGNPGSGWVVQGEKYYYLTDDGRAVSDQMTPDGFYINHNSEWYQRNIEILGVPFTAPAVIPSAHAAWIGKASLDQLKNVINQIFSQRTMRVTDDAVEYDVEVVTKSKATTSKMLLGLYKNTENDSYRLDLCTSLDSSSTDGLKAATYDYQVFRSMIYQISGAPEILEKAIYSSWEEDNAWNINRTDYVRVGDVWVKYVAASGCGRYFIKPVR